MENNKQNTALLTVIAVATLLVAVVGATFAYFTANDKTGTQSVVEAKAGKMIISYTDNSNVANLTAENFQPGDAILVTKEFTIKGINTAIGSVKVNENEPTTTGLEMPYIVEIEYRNEFEDGQLHYKIVRTDKENTVTSIFGGTWEGTVGTEKTGTFDQSIPKPTGTDTFLTSTAQYLELVRGKFPANSSDAGKSITFKLTMTFPDSGENQNANKGARFQGKIHVNREVDKVKA